MAKNKVRQDQLEADLQKKYYLRFRRAEQGMGAKHKKWAMIDMFDRGEQWKDASLPPWVPKPVNNLVRYFRTIKRANLASAIPKASFTPVMPQYEKDVDRLQFAYDHVWEEEKLDRLIRRCTDRAIAQGTAIAYVYNEEDYVGGVYYNENNPDNMMFQGRIRAKWWPNTNFFIDPDAFRLKDAKFIETTEILPLSAVKKNKKFIEYCGKDKIDKLLGDQVDREEGADGTIYERDNPPTLVNLGRVQGDEIATLHCHWERYINDEGQWQLDCSYYLKNNPYLLYRIEDIKPSEYPFRVLYFEEEEQDFWGTGLSESIIDSQKVVNKADQIASIIGVLNQNPQKVVARESGINAQELAKFGTMPGRVWTSNIDPTRSIHIAQPPDVPKGLFELSDRLKADMKDSVGISEAYTGQSVGSLTTSTGVNSLIERATIRDKDLMIQLDDFVEDLSDLIVKFILYTWKDKRPVMRTGANGNPEYDLFQPFEDLKVENMAWRVKSDVYARAPVTQASKKQQADNLMQMQGQFQFSPPIITPEEWIRMQDFENKEQMLQRMEVDRQTLQQQKAQDMAAMITNIAQQIAQAKAQGVAPQQAQQMALQAAQDMLQKKQSEDSKNGNLEVGDQPQGPKGVTGGMAMQAMAKGV